MGNLAIFRSVSHQPENYIVILYINWTLKQNKTHTHTVNNHGDVNLHASE